MTMKHKEKGFTIQIESRRNKPVVTKLGFVVIRSNHKYKGCNTITEDMLMDKFEAMEVA